MIAGDVMDLTATLLNDYGKTQFTYYVQLPYLNQALLELQEHCELNNIPVSNKVSTSIVVTAGVTTISSITSPALPTDLIEIQEISERLNLATENYIPMTRMEFLPTYVEQVESLIWWTWQNQSLFFIGATTDRQLQINYISANLTAATSYLSTISVFNAKSYLACRTAAFCASLINKDEDRAASLNNSAKEALDRFVGISTKGRQAIATRRRPFMAAYKTRGY